MKIGPFDQTWYCNEHGYDIAEIRPYAAYDVGADEWIVRPPHLPGWSVEKMNPAVVAEARAVSAYIESILQLPEPMRTQQGAALWDHLHSDRSRAFGPNGEGWYDPANVIEKWLDQSGLWAKLLHLKHNATHGTYDEDFAPREWSNTPIEALASHDWSTDIDSDDYERSHTDWDRYYDKVRPEIHRGMVLNLDPEDHDRVHDPSGTDEERGEALLHALKRRPVGMHWSDYDPEFAQSVTEDEATQMSNPRQRANATQVVLHAEKPKREHIETDMHRLVDKGVMDYASGSEGEIPLKEGAPVNVYGVSWKHRQEPNWHYHELDYPETMRHMAVGSAGELPEKLYIGIHSPHDWDDDKLHQLDEHYSGWADESPSSEVDLNDPDELRYVHAYDLGHPDPAKRRLPIGFIRYHENNVPRSVGKPYISVDNMAVHPDYRRRGVASAMQDKLADTYRGMHIDHGNRTPEGEAWARGWKKRASSDGDYWVDCDQGHEHWGANGAAGMLIRHTDKAGTKRYLLQKRAPWVDHGDTWGIPGGALGGSERPEEGARRETEEEMGDLPHDVRHSHTVTDDHGGWAYHTVIADSPHMFTPEGGDDEDESQGHGWFTAEEMKDLPLHPGFAKTWDAVRRSRTDKTAYYHAETGRWEDDPDVGPDELHDYGMNSPEPEIEHVKDEGDEGFDHWWNRTSEQGRQRFRQNVASRSRKPTMIGIGPPALHDVLDSGRMKNLHEQREELEDRLGDDPEELEANAGGNLSSGYFADRAQYEHHVMGVQDIDPRHKPIYGMLSDKPHRENPYGDYQIELKPHVRQRTTVTMGDSLNHYRRPYHIDRVPHLNDDELRAMTAGEEVPSMAEADNPKTYMEAQVHGGVGLKDIARIHLPEDEPEDSPMAKKIKSKGIEVVAHPREPDLTDEQIAILKGHR